MSSLQKLLHWLNFHKHNEFYSTYLWGCYCYFSLCCLLFCALLHMWQFDKYFKDIQQCLDNCNNINLLWKGKFYFFMRHVSRSSPSPTHWLTKCGILNSTTERKVWHYFTQLSLTFLWKDINVPNLTHHQGCEGTCTAVGSAVSALSYNSPHCTGGMAYSSSSLQCL